MYNISNNLTTNIFETLIGAFNIAPIRISGKYKFVVKTDNSLYLDDYSGRQTKLDLNQKFLPQIAKFLTISTEIVDNNILKYGAFQKSNIKSYHIPFYLGDEQNKYYPDYFVLSRVPNETISNTTFLYNYGKIEKIINLEEIGLINFFKEINSEDYFDYPIYLNWAEGMLKTFGYSIDDNRPIVISNNLINNQSNQPYFEVLNNSILNIYLNKKIFFPRFINIEFEFEYSNNYTYFNNFYGFLSISKNVQNIADLNFHDKYYIKLKKYTKSNNQYSHLQYTDTLTLNEYQDLTATASLKKLINKNPQIRYKINNIKIDDKIQIYHYNGDLEFEYIITSSDISKTSLFASLTKIANNCTILSNRFFNFTVIKNNNYCILKILANDIDSLIEDYVIKVPNYFVTLDRFSESDNNYNKLRSITDYDICVPGQPNLMSSNKIINFSNIDYTIIEKFKYNDNVIIRLNKKHNIDNYVECKIYNTLNETLISLNPIPFLNFNSDLKSLKQFDKNEYVTELKEKFLIETLDKNIYDVLESAIETFNSKKIENEYQYIIEDADNNELDLASTINIDDYNTEIVKHIMFASTGSTTFLTPNILNIDKHFYIQNGNLDTSKLTNDDLRFSWFLIKSECPNYLLNDIRSLRYFDDIPKITSRLIKITDSYSETIFLGVKYRLPATYSNYNFAVYLDFNNITDQNINYSVEIDSVNKTIYLILNKYLDYIDLIRGGSYANKPFLDLSFLLTTTSSFNKLSDNIDTFKIGGINIVPDIGENSYSFGITGPSQGINNWKYYDQITDSWYILVTIETLLVDGITNLLLILPESGDYTFYVYSTIKYNGYTYTYVSISITLKDIYYVSETYLWCKDVNVKFFDTEKIFIQKYNQTTKIEEIFYVDKTNYISSINDSNNIFGDLIKNVTIFINGNNQSFKLFTDSELSLKEYYFEINRYEIIDPNTNLKTVHYNIFKFPEFKLNLTNDQLIRTFFENIDSSYIIDNTNLLNSIETEIITINIFDRNQIWKAIKDIIQVNIRFKELNETQVRVNINELMLSNFDDYSQINSIKLNNFDEYLNIKTCDIDRNIAIWNLFGVNKIVLFNRQSTAYLPYFNIFDSLIEFQLANYKKYSTFLNIYDKNFGGDNINATGIWSEVQGNIISSLFCLDQDIEIPVVFSTNVNYKSLLKKYFEIDKIIINDKNEDYISKINKNIDEYIIDSFIDYILLNFYSLAYVKNENNNKIDFTVDKKNPVILYFNNLTIYDNYNQLIFVFSRK